jgi:hypothetical protein
MEDLCTERLQPQLHDSEDKVTKLLAELGFEDHTFRRKQTKPLKEYLKKHGKTP